MWGAYASTLGWLCAIKYVSNTMGVGVFWLNGLREAMVTSVSGERRRMERGDTHTHNETQRAGYVTKYK